MHTCVHSSKIIGRQEKIKQDKSEAVKKKKKRKHTLMANERKKKTP